MPNADRCTECGWPAVDLLVNDALALAVDKPYRGQDYWIYCSNPLCVNHVGEGYFQWDPDWWRKD